MNARHLIWLLAPMVLIGLLVVPPAMAGDDDESADPGAQLAGGVGAQAAELDAEVNERAFGQAIAEAAVEGDTDALAALIADRMETGEANLTALSAELDALQSQYEAGELSEGEYRFRLATLEVERQSLLRTTGEALNATAGIPADAIDAHGINVTAMEQLREQAHTLGGEEVRELARQIAGPNVGVPGAERPSMTDRLRQHLEQTDDPSVAIDRAGHWVAHTDRALDRQLDRAERFDDSDRGPVDEVDPAVWDQLEAANESLTAAFASLEDAQAALEAGDETMAIEHAIAAMEHATDANTAVMDAASALRPGPAGHQPGPPGNGPPGQ